MIGVDVVDIERLRGALARSPGLEPRLFSRGERAHCRAQLDPVTSFAGTLAAKEAVIKALELGPLVAWAGRIEVVHSTSGAPRARVGDRGLAVSIAHDGPVAVAVAFAPREGS